MGKQNQLLLAASFLTAVVHGPVDVGSAAPNPTGIAFKQLACLLRRWLPTGIIVEQVLVWLLSVFPVYLSAVDFQEELDVVKGDADAI